MQILKNVMGWTRKEESENEPGLEAKEEKVSRLKALFYSGVVVIAAVAPNAHAADDKFDGFKKSITDLIQGSLGKGVALIALLLGGLMGLAKSSAWPALTGLAIAAVFGLGPFLIETIFATFEAVGP